jgi:competence ComEA-like helix-hairpin-helix protein
MEVVRQNRIQSFAFVISIFIAFGLSCCLISNLTGFEHITKGNEIRLESLINPNEAPLASLARLPGIGIARAEAIITYRKNFVERNSNCKPFQSCDDLQKIKGIGPKTAQNIKQWLKFE